MKTPGEVDEPAANPMDEWTNAGWVPPSTPKVCPPLNFDDYPKSLPEAPVQMDADVSYLAWTSGRGLAVRANEVFVASAEHDSPVVLERERGDLLRVVNVGSRPEQVIVAPDGTAYLTIRHGASQRFFPVPPRRPSA